MRRSAYQHPHKIFFFKYSRFVWFFLRKIIQPEEEKNIKRLHDFSQKNNYLNLERLMGKSAHHLNLEGLKDISTHITLDDLRISLCCRHCCLRITNWTLHTTHCNQYTAHNTLQSTHCTQHTAINTLHTTHCPHHTAIHTLHTTHCTHHTAQTTLHTTHCTELSVPVTTAKTTRPSMFVELERLWPGDMGASQTGTSTTCPWTSRCPCRCGRSWPPSYHLSPGVGEWEISELFGDEFDIWTSLDDEDQDDYIDFPWVDQFSLVLLDGGLDDVWGEHVPGGGGWSSCHCLHHCFGSHSLKAVELDWWHWLHTLL